MCCFARHVNKSKKSFGCSKDKSESCLGLPKHHFQKYWKMFSTPQVNVSDIVWDITSQRLRWLVEATWRDHPMCKYLLFGLWLTFIERIVKVCKLWFSTNKKCLWKSHATSSTVTRILDLFWRLALMIPLSCDTLIQCSSTVLVLKT